MRASHFCEQEPGQPGTTSRSGAPFRVLAARVERSQHGFYVISKILLGKYRIRVSRQQMSELNLSADEEPAFEITADDQFESGIDFTLTQIIEQ